jgi:hypothetical protein
MIFGFWNLKNVETFKILKNWKLWKSENFEIIISLKICVFFIFVEILKSFDIFKIVFLNFEYLEVWKFLNLRN